MKENIIDKIFMGLLLCIIISNILIISQMVGVSKKQTETYSFDSKIQKLIDTSNQPVLIDQYKVGDDARPKTVLVYAVKLPIKRFIGDDQIETFTVVVE